MCVCVCVCVCEPVSKKKKKNPTSYNQLPGLGNIGDEYAETRHNIGFKIADKLALDAAVKFNADRYADVAEIKYKGKQIILIKPTTYMNLSGKAVNYWMQAEKIELEHTMVLVDELALPFGKIRIGPKGSDGGHNGLKSIQEVLNTTAYPVCDLVFTMNLTKAHRSIMYWENGMKRKKHSTIELNLLPMR